MHWVGPERLGHAQAGRTLACNAPLGGIDGEQPVADASSLA